MFFVVMALTSIMLVLLNFTTHIFVSEKPEESPYLQKVRDLAEKMEVFPIDFITRNGPLANFEYKRGAHSYRVTVDSYHQFSCRAELTREPFRQFYEFCQLALDATPEDIDVCLDHFDKASPKEKALLMTIMYIYILPWEKLDQFAEEHTKYFLEQWELLNEQLEQQNEQFWRQWEEQKELYQKDSERFWEQRKYGNPQEEFWQQFDLFSKQRHQQREEFLEQLKQFVEELKKQLGIDWYDTEGARGWSWFSRQFACSFDLTIRKYNHADSDAHKKVCLAKIKENIDDNTIAFPAIVMELDEKMGSNEDMETYKASTEEILRIVKINHDISSSEPLSFGHKGREYRNLLCQKIREEFPNDSQGIIADMLYLRYDRDMFSPRDIGLVRGNGSAKPKTVGQIAEHLLESWKGYNNETPLPLFTK